MRDWIGNDRSIYACIGASNHSDTEREKFDFYATDPKALELLLALEEFNSFIWEPACGAGHLSEVLKKQGYIVRATDLIDRGYGDGNIDFLKQTTPFNGDIITNPPYRYAKEFVEKAISLVQEGNRIAMFLKLTFLESQSRRELFNKYPPEFIYVSSRRLQCAKNGNFESSKKGTGTAVAYAWFIWRKGYTGEPRVRWFN
jgi:hypothetical protein